MRYPSPTINPMISVCDEGVSTSTSGRVMFRAFESRILFVGCGWSAGRLNICGWGGTSVFHTIRPIPLNTAAAKCQPTAECSIECSLVGNSGNTSGLESLTVTGLSKSMSTANKLPLSANAKQHLLPAAILSTGSSNGIRCGSPNTFPRN